MLALLQQEFVQNALLVGTIVAIISAIMGYFVVLRAQARSSTDDGEVPATSQITVAFLSAGREGELLVTAQVRKQGDHLLLADGDIEQNGKPIAHAVATFAVLER